MTSAAQVGELFLAAGTAFSKLGDMAMKLHNADYRMPQKDGAGKQAKRPAASNKRTVPAMNVSPSPPLSHPEGDSLHKSNLPLKVEVHSSDSNSPCAPKIPKLSSNTDCPSDGDSKIMTGGDKATHRKPHCEASGNSGKMLPYAAEDWDVCRDEEESDVVPSGTKLPTSSHASVITDARGELEENSIH